MKVMGVRSSGHTLAKMLQPFTTRAVRLVSVTHPEYAQRMGEFFTSHAAHALVLRGVHDRATVQVHLGRAHAHFGKSFGNLGHEAVIDRTLHQQTAACGAGLTGVLHDGAHDDGHSTLHIHIVKHDLRRLAAELEHALDGVLGRGLLDQRTDLVGARERDEVDAGVGRQSRPNLFAQAQQEAGSAFANADLYCEKFIEKPRHIEFQVLADEFGNVEVLGERECSVQRRHQKLIEEAPSAMMAPGVEDAMGEAAIKAAKAVGYFNAGTVEFIYQDGEFFFLEMNTRLQVEHPVTEVITGIDLVEWQIRVASGEPLPMTQEQVAAQRRGHGIEVRINAENPAGGKFLPSPGTISKLVAPDGFGVRFDAGYESGDTVSQYYDNLIGKLIVWGKDRPTAIARTIRALEELVVEGVATTIPADLAILRHPDFQAMEHSTKWVEERLDLSGIDAVKPAAPADDDNPLVERTTTVEVNGKRFDVKMWVPDVPMVAAGPAKAAKKPARAGGSHGSGGSYSPIDGLRSVTTSTSGDSSARKPPTSSGVGGRPVTSSATRRASVRRSASGAGFSPFSSSAASTRRAGRRTWRCATT